MWITGGDLTSRCSALAYGLCSPKAILSLSVLGLTGTCIPTQATGHQYPPKPPTRPVTHHKHSTQVTPNGNQHPRTHTHTPGRPTSEPTASQTGIPSPAHRPSSQSRHPARTPGPVHPLANLEPPVSSFQARAAPTHPHLYARGCRNGEMVVFETHHAKTYGLGSGPPISSSQARAAPPHPHCTPHGVVEGKRGLNVPKHGWLRRGYRCAHICTIHTVHLTLSDDLLFFSALASRIPHVKVV